LILQRIFTIPTDTFLIIFLKYSKDLRDFCGFDKVPDASKFIHLKQNFLPTYNIKSNIFLGDAAFNATKLAMKSEGNTSCIADRKTQNEKTIHADLLLTHSGIVQLKIVSKLPNILLSFQFILKAYSYHPTLSK